MSTYKQKFNKKHNFKSNESHSLSQISKLSTVSLKDIKEVFERGKGAYKTNPDSVRRGIQSPEQWGYARVYAFVMKLENKTINQDTDIAMK